MVKINKYEMRDGYQKKGQGTGDRLVTTENIPLRLVTLRSNVKPGVVRNVAVNKWQGSEVMTVYSQYIQPLS